MSTLLTRRNFRGQSLLKKVDGKTINVSTSDSARRALKKLATADNERLQEKAQRPIANSWQVKEEEEADIYAPPHDSSDEEGVFGVDIPPSSLKSIPSSSQGTRQPSRDPDFKPVRGLPGPRTSSQTDTASSPPLRSRRGGHQNAGPPLKKVEVEIKHEFKADSGIDFVNSHSQNRKKPIIPYGGASRRPAMPKRKSEGDSSPVATFKQYPKVEEKQTPDSPEKTFKNRIIEGVDPAESPAKRPKFKSIPDINSIGELEPDGPKFRIRDDLEDSELSGLEQSPNAKPAVPISRPEESQSQVPIFRLPPSLDSIYTDLSSFDYGKDASLANEDLDAAESSFQMPQSPELTRQSICPMCKEPVDADSLRTFSKGGIKTMREQATFCRSHKRKSGREEWIVKGYPTIDWEGLDTRIAQHRSFIISLVNGACCHSRRILEENIKSGKDRTLLQALHNSDLSLSPGYYGTRGLRAMTEGIMASFSPQLRKAAVNDRLVSSRGVTSYVQTVVVPELAVRLIMEDMSIDDEEAREVMKESAGLGDLMNEEVEDVVILRNDR